MNTVANVTNEMGNAEKLEELVALINMLTYAEDIAKSVGSNSASQHIKLASVALAEEFAQTDSDNKVSINVARRAAMSPSGNC